MQKSKKLLVTNFDVPNNTQNIQIVLGNVRTNLHKPRNGAVLKLIEEVYGLTLHIGDRVAYQKFPAEKGYQKHYVYGVVVGEANTHLIVINADTQKEELVYPWMLRDIVL